MTALEFLSKLRQLGITLSRNGDNLRIVADKNVLTPDLREELTRRKSELLDLLRDIKDKEEGPALQPVERIGDLPVSFAQRRLWFLDQLLPDSAFNVSAHALEMIGALNVEALRQALNAVVERHESLRTCFVTVQGEPVQRIAPSLELELRRKDLSSLPEAEHDGELRRQISMDAEQAIDLTKAPLMRVTLFKFGERRHVLLVVIHHIIADGWSIGVLLREITELYGAYREGKPSPLPPPAIQYADFAVWQRNWFQGKELEGQLDYWKTRLTGLTPLQLPTDHPRPPVQSFNGEQSFILLPVSLMNRLDALGRRDGATLYMTLLAAFQVVLARYTGQTDIVTGSPIANRNREEIERLLGFFVNMLVMRNEVSLELTFREFLSNVRRTTLDAYKYQDMPFEMLVEKLEPRRDLSRNPLFQILFVVQNAPLPPLELPDLKFEILRIVGHTTHFDLEVHAFEETEGLRLNFVYNTELFEQATVARMQEHFRVVLEAIAADHEQKIINLPMLTKAEQRQLIEDWGAAKAVHEPDQCLHEWFEKQARQTPDAVAVSGESSSLTNLQLNARANQLAHALRGHGVVPDTLVALGMDRTPEMLVAIMGVLKAGGAYVPLDFSYPRERLAFILEDAQTPLLITQESLREKFPPFAGKVIYLDSDWEAIALQSEENPAPAAKSENLAYVIYTSGSTGKPKGALITHYNVVRLMQATQPWYHFDPNDVWTLFHSYAFDFSVWEIWGALLYGGRLVVVPYLVTRSPEDFYRLLVDERVTVLNQTPSAFRQLMDAEQRLIQASDLSLRLIIFGGEALDLQSLRLWFERHGDQKPQLVNMYGITETTVHVTYRPISLRDLDEASGSVIGGAIPDLDLYILDGALQPRPVGLAGELCVGGAGLARGYLNRPEQTEQRFVPNPFSSRPGARLYRSGDLARHLPNGDIAYLGRIDQQVKIRGFRVELGEIESVLRQHPDVSEALVALREDTPGDSRLVAYLVPRDQNDSAAVSGLQQLARERLPEYMVPSIFVLLDDLPRLPNGKPNYRALPVPGENQAGRDQPYVAPRNGSEAKLAAIWSAVLHVSQIGIHDNFFALGGHSLLATQVVSRIREQFQVEVRLRSLFEAPTIAELAEVIEQLIVERLEQLSEDEAQQLIQSLSGSASD